MQFQPLDQLKEIRCIHINGESNTMKGNLGRPLLKFSMDRHLTNSPSTGRGESDDVNGDES